MDEIVKKNRILGQPCAQLTLCQLTCNCQSKAMSEIKIA